MTRVPLAPAVPADAAAADLAEPLSPLQVFFGLRGRIPRRTFWLCGVAIPIGLGAYFHGLLAIAGIGGQALEGLLNLGLLWSALAVSAKRWHDRDKTGWWALLQFVPVVGWVWTLVENGLLRGTAGNNRFGGDPTGRL
jgi:uncharacterized membrane protein YhaH (DUF805 family)